MALPEKPAGDLTLSAVLPIESNCEIFWEPGDGEEVGVFWDLPLSEKLTVKRKKRSQYPPTAFDKTVKQKLSSSIDIHHTKSTVFYGLHTSSLPLGNGLMRWVLYLYQNTTSSIFKK